MRPASWDVDYGEPLGLCKEVPGTPGVFRRQWSKATVEMDCGSFEGTITMEQME